MAQLSTLGSNQTFMPDIVINILLLPLPVALYGSGLLLWPVRRWLCRKRKTRGKILGVVFLVQVAVFAVILFLGNFYNHLMRLGYEWAILWIEFNLLFTIIGIFAWIRDSRFEKRIQSNHAA